MSNYKGHNSKKGKTEFHHKKSLGQNFLTDDYLIESLVDYSGVGELDSVLEIGPGMGIMTKALCSRCKKVISVEIDDALIPILKVSMNKFRNFTLVHGDVMKLNLDAFVDEHMTGLIPIVCANLPYNITTPVLTSLIDSHRFAAITVMIQREVALRICAAPGNADYGAFGIFVQWYMETELLFDWFSEQGIENVGGESLAASANYDKSVSKLLENLFDEEFIYNVAISGIKYQ